MTEFTISRLGSPFRKLVTEDEQITAQDALTLAGYATDGYEVRVNGAPATPGSPVKTGDFVSAVPKLKAG